MKKIVSFILIISLCLTICSCNSASGSQNRMSEYFADKEVKYFLDDGSILCGRAPLDGSITYYRYYPEENKSVELGTLTDVISSRDLHTEYNGNIYIYYWVKNPDTGSNENILYELDMTKNAINEIKKEGDESYWGNTAYFLDGSLVTMKNRLDGNLTHTYIETYDFDTGEYTISHENTYDKTDKSGSGIQIFCADGEYLYYIIDEYTDDGACLTYFRQFDKNGSLKKSVALPEEFLEIKSAYGRYVRMEVLGNYLYLENASLGYSCVAEIGKGELKIINQGTSCKMPIDYNPLSGVNPVLYKQVSDEADCQMFDISSGGFEDISPMIENEITLRNVWQNADSVLIQTSDEEGGYAYFIIHTEDLPGVSLGDENTAYYKHN